MPANFFLFPKLKTSMKGKRFSTIEEIKEELKQQLLAIQKNRVSEEFQGLKKNAGIRVLYLSVVTLRGKRKLLRNE